MRGDYRQAIQTRELHFHYVLENEPEIENILAASAPGWPFSGLGNDPHFPTA